MNTVPPTYPAAQAAAVAAEVSTAAVEKEIALIPLVDTGVANAVTTAAALAASATQAAKATTAAVGLIPAPLPVVKNAEFYGAKGDGVTDDTKALNAMLATGEGLFDQPGKTYMVNYTGVQVTKKTKIRVLPTATNCAMKMIPNNQDRYYILRLTKTAVDCDIDTGTMKFVGDRDRHVYAAGATHEHGYGIFVSGQRNKVYSSAGLPGLLDARGATPAGSMIINCTGDGMGTSGPGHNIYGFIFDFDRRQGISAFECSDVEIHHCTIRNIGNAGKPDPSNPVLIGPFACIDLEPDAGMGDVNNVRIHHCRLETSRTALTVWIRSDVTSKITGSMYDCDCVGQANGAWLKDAGNRTPNRINFSFMRNTWINNRNRDIFADQGSTVTVGDATTANANYFDDINSDLAYKPKTGQVSPEVSRSLTGKVVVGLNMYNKKF